MRSRRTIRLLLISLTVAALLTAAAPDGAWAGSLLSGYGGPGGGAQAILGSTLINGGSGRGGDSGAGGSGANRVGASGESQVVGRGSTGAQTGRTDVAGARGLSGEGSGSGNGSQGTGGHRGSASGALATHGAYGQGQAGAAGKGAGSGASAGSGGASAGASAAYKNSGLSRVAATSDAGSLGGPLGFTGADLLALLLALAVLAITAVFTRGLARMTH
jgi:hypothetical protein